MTPKEDIDALIDWLISEANEGKIEIHNIEYFEKSFRLAFYTLHRLRCKHLFGHDKCYKFSQCDGYCDRMNKYSKKFLNQPVGDSDKF